MAIKRENKTWDTFSLNMYSLILNMSHCDWQNLQATTDFASAFSYFIDTDFFLCGVDLHDIKYSAPILEFTSVFYVRDQGLQDSEQWHNTDFWAQYVSVHKQCPFSTFIKAKNESWKTVSRSKGLVSRKNRESHNAHLSLACVLHNRASAVIAHGLILAGWFNIYRVPIKFIGWQLVAPVVIYKQQQQHNTDMRKSKRNSMPLCNIQHWRKRIILQTSNDLSVIHPYWILRKVPIRQN